MNVNDIADKDGHTMQADISQAQLNKMSPGAAAKLEALSRLKAVAQRAVDELWEANSKASKAVYQYNEALSASGHPGKQFFYTDIFNNLKIHKKTVL